MAKFDYLSWNTGYYGVVRKIFCNYSISSYCDIVSNGDVAADKAVQAKITVVANDGTDILVSLCLLVADYSSGEQRAIAPNTGTSIYFREIANVVEPNAWANCVWICINVQSVAIPFVHYCIYESAKFVSFVQVVFEVTQCGEVAEELPVVVLKKKVFYPDFS